MALKVCLQWPTVGPYHAARIEAVAALAEEHNIRLVVCETAAEDLTGLRQAKISIPVERVTVLGDQPLAGQVPWNVQRKTMEVLDLVQPDVVAITGNSTPEARGCLAWCIGKQRRAVLMTDSREEDAPRVAWREALKSVIVRSYDAALVAGTPHRAYVRKLGMDNTAIFEGYDVVDNDFFAAEAVRVRRDPASIERLPGLPAESPYFLAVGRMIARKNFETLLMGYRTYALEVDVPWRLIIVGDGQLRRRLAAYVSEHQLRGVMFAGVQGYADMPAYYGLAGAFVHTAVSDQWALVVNEAMASGLPVIVSTGTGSCQDLVVEEKTGLRFESLDHIALAEAMKRMSLDDDLRRRLGDGATRQISAWSLNRFADSLVAAAKHAAARPARTRIWGRLALWGMGRLASELSSFQRIET